MFVDINKTMNLDNIPDNIPWFSLNGITCECKVISVYDADTVTIVLPFSDKFYKVKCRLYGIDSAEKRTKNKDEKKVALESTKWLSDLIKDKIIWVKCGKWGKYGGRMIGELFMSKEDIELNVSINEMIIKKGYAYKYNGKKKIKFDKWFNINI
jgi:endonuclease YncB( thermonuclease family)